MREEVETKEGGTSDMDSSVDREISLELRDMVREAKFQTNLLQQEGTKKKKVVLSLSLYFTLYSSISACRRISLYTNFIHGSLTIRPFIRLLWCIFTITSNSASKYKKKSCENSTNF